MTNWRDLCQLSVRIRPIRTVDIQDLPWIMITKLLNEVAPNLQHEGNHHRPLIHYRVEILPTNHQTTRTNVDTSHTRIHTTLKFYRILDRDAMAHHDEPSTRLSNFNNKSCNAAMDTRQPTEIQSHCPNCPHKCAECKGLSRDSPSHASCKDVQDIQCRCVQDSHLECNDKTNKTRYQLHTNQHECNFE